MLSANADKIINSVDDLQTYRTEFLAIFGLSENADGLLLGSNTLGKDLKLFGVTTGKYNLWDASANQLNVHGSQKFHNHLTTDSYGMQTRTEYNAATGDFFGIDAETHQYVSRTAGGVRGLSMCTRLVSDATVSGTANLVGVHGLLDIDGTLNGSGLHAAVVAKVDAGGTFTAVSHLASLWVDSLQAGTVNGNHELIYMTNNGATIMDSAFFIYSGHSITNLFTITTAPAETNILAADASGESMTVTHKIKLSIDGNDVYLQAGTMA